MLAPGGRQETNDSRLMRANLYASAAQTDEERVRELLRAFRKEFRRKPTVLEATAIRRAAQLVAIAERARAAALHGEYGLEQLVRIERLSEQAVRRLHLGMGRRERQNGPSLAEYLKEAAE